MRLPFFMLGIPTGSELAELESLIEDLRSYIRGDVPEDEILASASSMSGWAPIDDTTSCRLAGTVVGHPMVGPGLGTTSRIIAIGRSGRWARSATGLWRLGPSIGLPGSDL